MPLKGTKTRAAYFQRDRRARLKSAQGDWRPARRLAERDRGSRWRVGGMVGFEALTHPGLGILWRVQPLTLPQYGVDFLRDALGRA